MLIYILGKCEMSCLCADGQKEGKWKVEQHSARAEFAIVLRPDPKVCGSSSPGV